MGSCCLSRRITNNNYQWPSIRHAAATKTVWVYNVDAINVDALIALSSQVTSLTNMVKDMTTSPATVNQVAEDSIFIVEMSIYMIIALKIQLQSITWVTSIDKIKVIHIRTLATFDGDNTQTFHWIIRTRLLQYLVDRTNLLSHLVFAINFVKKN